MHPFVGNCRSCNYPLVRLTEPRCPECGTPFDPDDPSTMQFHFSRLSQFLATKTSVWTLFPAFLTAGLFLGLRLTYPDRRPTTLAGIAAILTLIATFYTIHARLRFQFFLRKREKERQKKTAAKNP